MSENAKVQELLEFQKAIEASDFEVALSLIENSPLTENVKFFNKAYVYYKAQNWSMARLSLEKAQYKGMMSKELDDAFTILREESGLKYTEDYNSQYDHFVLHSASLPTYFYPTIASIMVFMALVLVWYRKKIFACIPVIIASLSLYCFVTYSHMDVYIAENERPIHGGPSRIFEEVQTLLPGAKVIYSKFEKDWKYIEYPSTMRGWVYKNKDIKL